MWQHGMYVYIYIYVYTYIIHHIANHGTLIYTSGEIMGIWDRLIKGDMMDVYD